jgi:hypothetical protein
MFQYCSTSKIQCTFSKKKQLYTCTLDLHKCVVHCGEKARDDWLNMW